MGIETATLCLTSCQRGEHRYPSRNDCTSTEWHWELPMRKVSLEMLIGESYLFDRRSHECFHVGFEGEFVRGRRSTDVVTLGEVATEIAE